MKYILMVMTILLLSTTNLFAQETKEVTPAPQVASPGLNHPESAAQTLTPEQTAITLIQQQRNQALAQVGDMQASQAYLQSQQKLVAQYWADYVKGLYGDNGMASK